jgi:hypothetical protein
LLPVVAVVEEENLETALVVAEAAEALVVTDILQSHIVLHQIL